MQNVKRHAHTLYPPLLHNMHKETINFPVLVSIEIDSKEAHLYTDATRAESICSRKEL